MPDNLEEKFYEALVNDEALESLIKELEIIVGEKIK